MHDDVTIKISDTFNFLDCLSNELDSYKFSLHYIKSVMNLIWDHNLQWIDSPLCMFSDVYIVTTNSLYNSIKNVYENN